MKLLALAAFIGAAIVSHGAVAHGPSKLRQSIHRLNRQRRIEHSIRASWRPKVSQPDS